MNIKKSKNSGFTLIELMIVIGIIGVLAGIALPNFARSRDKARLTKCFEFSTLLSRTAEVYAIEKGPYPEKIEDMVEYLSRNRVPTCPSGGVYRFLAKSTNDDEGVKVECTVHGCATSTWGG